MPNDWRGSIRSHNGWLLLRVKDASGKWVERTSRIRPEEPGAMGRANKLLVSLREKLRARSDATDSTAPVTVRAWAEKWLKERERCGILDFKNDRSRLEHHVYPEIGGMLLEEVKPRHLDIAAKAWAAAGKAPRTRRNIYSVVKALFRDARIAGLLEGPDPCILTHRQLGKARDANPGWRATAKLSRDELELLVSDERIPQDRRVWYGLLGIGMLRTGEGAGLRWASIQPAEPLGRLVVKTSYGRGRTKTDEPRWMPIHPALASLLAEWKLGGWARAFGRTPTPEDLVCPVTLEKRKGRAKPTGAMRDKNYARKRWLHDLATLELRHRRAHDLRRTGISIAQDDGANRDHLRWATHAPPREVFDMYTTLEWATVCQAVAALNVRVRTHKLPSSAPNRE